MAKTGKTDDWLPMAEVVARTGMSQRTVYRMVGLGRLKQAQRQAPGRRPLSVFDPADVAEISEGAVRPAPGQQRTGEPPEAIPSDSLLPPSELSFKLYLSEQEAVRYTGFGRAFLRAHGKGRPIGPRGSTIYRRVDLEKL